MNTQQQLSSIRAKADASLKELMHHLNHAPQLVAEIKPLVLANDILAEFQSLSERNPELAEQVMRMSLATLVNYNTSVETSAQLQQLESESSTPSEQPHGE